MERGRADVMADRWTARRGLRILRQRFGGPGRGTPDRPRIHADAGENDVAFRCPLCGAGLSDNNRRAWQEGVQLDRIGVFSDDKPDKQTGRFDVYITPTGRRTCMPTFSFFGKSVNLPAVLVSNKATTRDPSAWQYGMYTTVQLTGRLTALRVHTAGRTFPGRQASDQMGAWVLIGDVIQTSTDLANSRSLPTVNPRSMVAFTHTSGARLATNTVLNIGLASAKFGGTGGGFQAEYVSGPTIQFTPLAGKHWHGGAGHA